MANIKKSGSGQRLKTLQSELDKVLADLIEPHQDKYLTRARRLEVHVDIYETSDALHVCAELPGIDKKDVQLFVSRDLLMIEGKKKSPYKGDKLRFLNLERDFGAFSREVGIPKPVDGRSIDATMENGILHVVLPKISDRRGQRKRVPIK